MARERGGIPSETLMGLRRRLAALPGRDPGRRAEVGRIAELFGVSSSTVYRALASVRHPKGLRRADRGRPRAADASQMNRYCTIVAALKVRTTNGQGRKLSTSRAIEILEDYGVHTPEGLVRAPKGLLKRATVDRWLQAWGYDHRRMVRAPAAVRFEARRSNECWQFDMSPSDLKRLPRPEWVEPGRGEPTVMLFSVVDDRSGVAYQEYRCVYGEDAESALRFLFNAMAPKEDGPFQGVPEMLYLDNGPVARSLVFQAVMERLGVDWRTHMPAGSDGARPTARSKGKVERPVSHREGGARNSLSLPQAGNRGGGQCVALELRRQVQRETAPARAAQPHRGLDRESARVRLSRDVLVGAVLCIRPRARTAHGRLRRPHFRPGRALRSGRRARWRGRWSFGGDCSITSSSSNGARSVSARIGPRAGRSRCTAIESAGNPRAKSAPRRSPP